MARNLTEPVGRVEITIVDIGIAQHLTGITEEVGGHCVLGREVVFVKDVWRWDIMFVVAEEVVHDPLRYNAIARAGKRPNPLILQIGRWVNQAGVDA
jgi:hypothetical protein